MLLRATGCEPGKSNYGRAIMVGLPVAALIGGMGTPAGSATNVLSLTVLENTAGIQVTFTQWACLGVPIVLLLVPIVYKIVWCVYRPEITSLQGMENAQEQLRGLGQMKGQEKKFIAVMLLLILAWLTESVHGLPIAITTTLGALVFFLPGIDVLNWENTKNAIMWDIILVVNSCSALGSVIWDSGAAAWIANDISVLLDGQSVGCDVNHIGTGDCICPFNLSSKSSFGIYLRTNYLHHCCSAGAKSRLPGHSHRLYGISGLLDSIRRNSTGLLWIRIF